MSFPVKQIGSYQIKHELGHGGMGAVYYALHSRTNEAVAIKLIMPERADEDEARYRFEREGKIGLQLEHPNIVKVLEVGQTKVNGVGCPYIVMEYVGNGSLAREVGYHKEQQQPMSIEDTVSFLRPIANALDYAHTRNVLHRDIKPSNVLIDDRGHILLSDFGIARFLGANATKFTKSDRTLGTIQYMSPEQANAEPNLSPRADIYSLGVMAYEMLTNELPFSDATPAKLLTKIVSEPPIAPEIINPALPPKIASALRRVLAKNPGQRFVTANEFVDALETGLVWTPGQSTPAMPRPSSQLLLQGRALRRRRLLTGLLLGIVGLILITIGIYSFVTKGGLSNNLSSLSAIIPATFTVEAYQGEVKIPIAQVATSTPAPILSDTPTNIPTATDNLVATATALQNLIDQAIESTRQASVNQTTEAAAATTTALAIATETPTPSPVATESPSSTPTLPTATLTPNATATMAQLQVLSALATAKIVSEAATQTAESSSQIATVQAIATATSTLLPTATSTLSPPTLTFTVVPSATNPPEPTTTSTPIPTHTLRPSPTRQPLPTSTPLPTFTLVVVSTQTATATENWEPTNTIQLTATKKPPTETPLPTNRATSSPTQRVALTSTPLPTSTQAPTLAPTPVPPTHTAAPKATITPQRNVADMMVVTILSPLSDALIKDEVLLQWTANVPLPAGYVFEPSFWQGDGDPFIIGRGWVGSTTNSSIKIKPKNFGSGAGIYHWGILLRDANNQPVKLVSSIQRLVVQIGDTPPSSSDGGNPAPVQPPVPPTETREG